MAKNSFNFQAKMGLDTKEFKRGVSQANAALGRLKSTFSSLAAGIGLGLGLDRLVGTVKETAVKLDTAMNTLKNASTTTKTFKSNVGEVTIQLNNFKENLSFVKDLSNKYGQDLVSLTDSFAKFTAAARGTSIGLDDQKYIFEQLTRAAGAFHLSADRTSDMMNAVVQMMSKGKVAAEELRRQLGNTLPGAFNIMAAAMGVSTAQLENMMKNGEVLAEEALPAFAAQLERITKNANFESLQKDINDFKNAWYEVVEASNSSGLFKNLYKTSTDILIDVADNFKSYMTAAQYAVIGLLAGQTVVRAFVAAAKHFKTFKAQAVAEIDAIDNRLKKLHETLALTYAKFPNVMTHTFGAGELDGSETKETLEMMKEYNQLLLRKNELHDDIGKAIISTHTIEQSTAQRDIDNIGRKIAAIEKTENQIVSSGRQWDVWKKKGSLSLKWVVNGAKNFGKALYASLGPIGLISIALTAVGAIIGKMIGKMQQYNDLVKEVNSISINMNESIGERMAPTEKEIDRVNDLVDSFTKLAKAGEDKKAKGLYRELQEAVPALKNISYEDIAKKAGGFELLAKKTKEWADNLRYAASLTTLLDEKSAQKKQLEDYNKKIKDIEESGKALTETRWVTRGGMVPSMTSYEVLTEEGRNLEQYKKGVEETTKAIEDLNNRISALQPVEVIDKKNGGTENPLTKIVNDHSKKIEELKNQKREIEKALEGPGEVAEESVKEALANIEEDINEEYINAFKNAAATGELVLSQIQEKVANGQSLTKLERWYLDLATMAAKATSDIAEKVAIDAAEKGVEKWAKEIKDKQKEFLSNIKNLDGDYEVEKVQDRDKRLDYKKDNLEIASEEFDVAQSRVDALNTVLEKLKEDYKNAFEEEPPQDIQEFLNVLNKRYQEFLESDSKEEALALLNQMIKDLEALQIAADTFEDVAIAEEMIVDLKELQREIKATKMDFATGLYDEFGGFVGNVDGVVNAFQRLNDVVEDLDSTGWDKFMASFEIFTSIMDTVLGVMEGLNTLMELNNIITELGTQRKQALNNALAQEIALEGANAVAKTAAAGAATADAAATATEAAAAAANTKVKSGEAIANATASGSKMPFPFNLMAIAAGVAAVVAALASISKFEKGGIVGGNSTRGDKNIARVNSGEMILNKHQQSTLWSMINGKGGVNGNVNFKIKGSDLIGVINNETSRRRG